ncbi:MAG: TonB-dependent receptor [Bacteroidia bacterium]
MKTLIHIFIYLLLFTGISFAQNTLTGSITNHKGQALEAAHIVNLNGEHHAHSNELGNFSLTDTKVGDSVRINLLGYAPQRILIKDLSKPLTVQLLSKQLTLNTVEINHSLDAITIMTDVDLLVRPVNSSQELLRAVPGLMIGQHAGGGKAEQIFLRGFDIDHGTDVNITVDGMPVNMVSHAHGQGYADLHFLIPETIERIDFGKGPYAADQGNFATAGNIAFRSKEQLDASILKLEVGQFNTRRMLAMLDVVDQKDHQAYIALERLTTNGPFESSQDFHRINVMGKYTGLIGANNKISVSASHFDSRWDASGQIPQRAVDQGLIGRFGAIDDTEGGSTSRSNVILTYDNIINSNSSINTTAYYSHYNFELFSNFTFFLNDPENGDQIRQFESRDMFGFQSTLNHAFDKGLIQTGVGLRDDFSKNNSLSRTKNRKETLSFIQQGDVHETNMFAFVNTRIELGKFEINPGLRVDQFTFNYLDQLKQEYNPQTVEKATLSPKLNLLYNPTERLQLYIKTGKGFHANDTRVILEQQGRQILPAAYGADLGAIWKPFASTFVNVALWHLALEQEFVYVGDEGIVEPGGETRRSGIEVSSRTQLAPWLYANMDLTYTIARGEEEEGFTSFIPLAPDLTFVGGLHVKFPAGINGGINVRRLGNRPANEDNSIVAEGYTVTDLNAGYQGKHFDLSFAIQNLFNVEWKETQFATESRLQNEAEAVKEIHFTPGTPFFFKATIGYRF